MFDMADWDQDETRVGDENSPAPVFVSAPVSADLEFSVVTLVTDDETYGQMVKSFVAKGFSAETTEFVALDNRDTNRFDGFSGLRAVASQLRGKHIIFAHQDVELTEDGIEALREVLARLEIRDPNWMIAGNSGLYDVEHLAHLEDPHGIFRLSGDDAREVRTLDENFLVMPRARMPLGSLDLEGFHLYATDMCLQARSAGGSAYVVPFFLRHHSGGAESVAFRKLQVQLQEKYAGLGVSGRLKAPASNLYFGWRGRVIRSMERWAEWSKRQLGRIVRLFARSARENTETK